MAWAAAPGGQIGTLWTIRKCLCQRKGPCVCPNALSCLFLSSGPQSWEVTGRDRRAETRTLLGEQMPRRGHSLSALTRLCCAAQVRTPWGPSSLAGGAFVFSQESGYFLGNCVNRAGQDKCALLSLSLFTFMHWRRKWQPTPAFLPGESHGRRSLVGCSPWGREESDTTERLHFHLSLSFIGEVNGSPLQCSCLENPRDGGAWWAAVYGVAQSRTRLKRFSSSTANYPREHLL